MDECDAVDAYAASLEAGNAAIASGDWEASLGHYRRAVALADEPEALEGLGMAAWWLDEADLMFQSRERAFTRYRRKKNDTAAARIAIWLALDNYVFRFAPAIANGWLNRAQRILDTIESPSFEHCFISFCRGHIALEEHDTEAADRYARHAQELARQVGLIDLEVLALALHGLAQVSAGRVDHGMSLLDEAVTAALAGELSDPDAIVTSCCYLFYACERVRDYRRAAQWCDTLAELCQRWSYRSMVSVCRVHYAGILIWQGEWVRAEQELNSATSELLAGRAGWAREGFLRLADLRRRQGRVDEAVRLYQRVDDHPMALVGRAELAYEQGDLPTAFDLATRFLRRVREHELTEHVDALELLVRIAVANGDIEAAEHALVRLESASETVGTDPIRATALYARGLVAAACNDDAGSQAHFEDAVDLFESCGSPFDAARARLELARILRAAGRGAIAIAECRAALETFERLGAQGHARIASSLLWEMPTGDSTRIGAPGNFPALTRRESQILRRIVLGESNAQIADELFLSVRTVERHVSSIYQKIGVRGRTARAAAAAYAAEHDSTFASSS